MFRINNPSSHGALWIPSGRDFKTESLFERITLVGSRGVWQGEPVLSILGQRGKRTHTEHKWPF
jgi:hypothetical protein